MKLGGVFSSTYLVNRAEGQDSDEALKSALMMSIFDIAMSAREYGKILGLGNKVFRIWKDGKPHDVLLTTAKESTGEVKGLLGDGKSKPESEPILEATDVTGKVTDAEITAEVIAKEPEPTFDYSKPTKEFVHPISKEVIKFTPTGEKTTFGKKTFVSGIDENGKQVFPFEDAIQDISVTDTAKSVKSANDVSKADSEAVSNELLTDVLTDTPKPLAEVNKNVQAKADDVFIPINESLPKTTIPEVSRPEVSTDDEFMPDNAPAPNPIPPQFREAASRLRTPSGTEIEADATIKKQFASANKPNSPRSAVLVNHPNQFTLLPENHEQLFTPIDVEQGVLFVNNEKAKHLGLISQQDIENYVKVNGITDLINIKQPISDEEQDLVVQTLDKDGNELATTAVPNDPEIAKQQIEAHKAEFGDEVGSQTVLPVADAVEIRKQHVAKEAAQQQADFEKELAQQKTEKPKTQKTSGKKAEKPVFAPTKKGFAITPRPAASVEQNTMVDQKRVEKALSIDDDYSKDVKALVPTRKTPAEIFATPKAHLSEMLDASLYQFGDAFDEIERLEKQAKEARKKKDKVTESNLATKAAEIRSYVNEQQQTFRKDLTQELSRQIKAKYPRARKSVVSKIAEDVSEYLVDGRLMETDYNKKSVQKYTDDLIDDFAKDEGLSAKLPTKEAEKSEVEKPNKKTETTETTHDFSSTQVNLSQTDAAKIIKFGNALIKDEDLADTIDWSPREENPHITVKYGLHSEKPGEVQKLLGDVKPFEVTLGKTSIFPASEGNDYDVVKIDVNSPELHQVNKLISDNVKVTDTHPTYQPHITLAYVKAGKGKDYVGNATLEGTKIAFSEVAFSDKDGKETAIALKDTSDKLPDKKTPKLKPVAENDEITLDGKDFFVTGVYDDSVLVKARVSEIMPNGVPITEVARVSKARLERNGYQLSEKNDLQTVEEKSNNTIEETNNADSIQTKSDNQIGDASEQSANVQGTPKLEKPAGSSGLVDESGDGNLQRSSRTGTRQSTSGKQRTDVTDSRNESGDSASDRDRDLANDRIRAERNAGKHDYIVKPGSLVRSGSWKDSANTNFDALELLAKLEDENRLATPEEQVILAKYVGWGASELANNVFAGINSRNRTDIYPSFAKDGWKDIVQRAKDYFDGKPQELAAALQSTQNAHFTPESVIRGIWNGLQQIGFKSGAIFEPGAGIGLFASTAPKDLIENSRYTAIEREPATAGIAKQLLQKQTIINGDFITQKFPENYFDVAVGNPPFQDLKVLNDPKYKSLRLYLHDYFFAKTIDLVRPGGVLVFVTSKGTLNKGDDTMRQYIADKADLLGAIRLPQTAFKENAGTEVVTDVIFLRKRLADEARGGENWLNLADVQIGEQNQLVNEYFVNHPEMVIGKHAIVSGRFGPEYSVTPNEGDFATQFNEAIGKLPVAVYSSERTTQEIIKKAAKLDFSPTHVKEGNIYLDKEGILRVKAFGVGVELKTTEKLSNTEHGWLTDYVGLRSALKAAQNDQLNDGEWEKSLAGLNQAYKNFVKKNGHINKFTTYEKVEKEDGEPKIDADGNIVKTSRRKFTNSRLLDLDIESPLVRALESIDENGNIIPAKILSGRTIKAPVAPKIESVIDALNVSLDQTGTVNLTHIAELIQPVEQLTPAQVFERLGDKIFESPDGTYHLDDDYLSGFVIDKLEEAKIAAADNPKFERNVKALEAVQPLPLDPSRIAVTLGAAWVPAKYVAKFANEVLQTRSSVTFRPETNVWQVSGAEGPGSRSRRQSSAEFGTEHRSPDELLDAALNNRTVKITAKDLDGKVFTDEVATSAVNEVIKRIKNNFKTWVWQDAKRAGDLTNLYNNKFNNIAPRRFNGDHLTVPGLSAFYKLHPHQRRAVSRVVQSGNTYLAHSVGAGKTLEMIVSAMEQKRLGLIHKPMFIVPSHALQQFGSEFLEAYPLANILVADEQNFSKEKRKAFVAKTALNDLDGVIMTHSAFKKLRTQPATTRAVVDDIIRELQFSQNDYDEDTQDGKRTIKQIQSRIDKIEQKFLSQTSDEGRDDVVNFEDLGVDFLYVDEAHNFRKLDYTTNLLNVKGIQPNGSQMALDLLIKSRWLNKQKPGRSMVMASGTPITNTMAELYSVMRFMDQDELDRAGLSHFDAWASQFGETVGDYEMNAAGNMSMLKDFHDLSTFPN